MVVPSKVYDILANGRPVAAVASERTEIARWCGSMSVESLPIPTTRTNWPNRSGASYKQREYGNL